MNPSVGQRNFLLMIGGLLLLIDGAVVFMQAVRDPASITMTAVFAVVGILLAIYGYAPKTGNLIVSLVIGFAISAIGLDGMWNEFSVQFIDPPGAVIMLLLAGSGTFTVVGSILGLYRLKTISEPVDTDKNSVLFVGVQSRNILSIAGGVLLLICPTFLPKETRDIVFLLTWFVSILFGTTFILVGIRNKKWLFIINLILSLVLLGISSFGIYYSIINSQDYNSKDFFLAILVGVSGLSSLMGAFVGLFKKRTVRIEFESI